MLQNQPLFQGVILHYIIKISEVHVWTLLEYMLPTVWKENRPQSHADQTDAEQKTLTLLELYEHL